MGAARARLCTGDVSELQFAVLESTAPDHQKTKAMKKNKTPGIRYRADGSAQTSKMIRGARVWKSWKAGTPESTMLAWREDQAKRAPAPVVTATPPADSFAADIVHFGKRRAAAVSITQHVATLESFAATLGRDRRSTSITAAEIQIVAQAWLARGLAPVTVRRYLSDLQGFFTELYGAAANPVRQVKKPKAPKYGEPRALDYDVIEHILAHVERRRTGGRPSLAYYRLRALAYTGIPPGVLGQLTRPDLHLADALVDLPARLKGDGVEARTIPVTAQGVESLQELVRVGGLGRFDPTGSNRSWQTGAIRAGVVDETGAVVTTQYDLRHSFGTMLYRLTRDIATVGRFLGHAEGSPITLRYALGAHRDVDRAAAGLASERIAAAIAEQRRRSFDTNAAAV